MSDSGLGIIVAGAVGAYGGSGKSSQISRAIGPIVANVTIEERHEDIMEITEHPIEQGAAITDHTYKRAPEVTIRCGWSDSAPAPTSLLGGIVGSLIDKLSGLSQNAITTAAQTAIGGSALGNLAVAKLSSLTANQLTSFGSQVNSGKGKGTSKVKDIYSQLLDLQVSAVPFDLYTGKRKYSNMMIRSLIVETDRTSENALTVVMICRQLIIVQTRVSSVTADPVNQASPEKTAPVVDSGTKRVNPVDPTSNAPLLLAMSSY